MFGASIMMGLWTSIGPQLAHWEDVRSTIPRVSSGEGGDKGCWVAMRCLDLERDLDLLRGSCSW